VNNKVLMTASAEGVILRQSPTQQSARCVNLHGVAIIVCCNSWLDDNDDSDDAKWLRKNSECVDIQGKLYRSGTASSPDLGANDGGNGGVAT